MRFLFFAAFLYMTTITLAQRPFYAGRRPIGQPELADRFKGQNEDNDTATVELNNRVGEDGQPTTTEQLPVDALGDRELVDRISKWPVDKQPYWYINWKQIEAHRQQRPNQGQQTTQTQGQGSQTGQASQEGQPQRPAGQGTQTSQQQFQQQIQVQQQLIMQQQQQIQRQQELLEQLQQLARDQGRLAAQQAQREPSMSQQDMRRQETRQQEQGRQQRSRW